MVSTSNKILTVSYGTFSCTLEGFDDSFSTMKAIAEYFRDLAADDRYFGAEPPTPDADMLARIAEREVSQRVEARLDGNDVVLRAQTPAIESAPNTSEPSSAQPLSSADDADPEVDPEPAADTDELPAFEMSQIIDDDVDADMSAAAAQEAWVEPSGTEEGTVADPTGDEPEVANESVSSKLEKIRAVVDDDGGADFADEDYSEELADTDVSGNKGLNAFLASVDADDKAEAEKADTSEKLSEETLAAIYEPTDPQTEAEVEAVDDATAPKQELAEIDDDEDVFADVEQDIEAALPDDDDFEDSADESDDDDTPNLSSLDVARRARARVIKVQRAGSDDEIEDAVLHSEDSEQTDGGDDSLFGEAFDEKAEAETSDTSLFDEGAVTELDEKIDELTDEPNEEDEDEALAASISAAIGATSLSDADEAELMAELTDVEKDRDGLTTLEEDGVTDDREGEVSRLLDKTESELAKPESDRRRSAIAHLKAAVAATKAEREVTGEPRNQDATEEYRDDLAQVVRPRRATTSNPETPRPSVVPPLKLVAEQRVDVEETSSEESTSDPVRPRRVAAKSTEQMDTAAAVSSTFAEFAETMGAEDLPDLLEAAAAYTAYVEGQPHFSRPQVMKQVARIRGDNAFTREDGLRSFGQLLRQGKIQKLKRGQFVVSEDTRFKPEARIAGE